MTRKKQLALFAAFSLAICVPSFSLAAHTQSETVIYGFGALPDGQNPVGGLIFDQAGNLYGTTSAGGNNTCAGGEASCGTVFELSPISGGGWTETILYRFTGGSDGWNPGGILLMDASGNLLGTTSWGGMNCGIGDFGCGVVFKLSPGGGTWTNTTLYTFTGAHDGAVPLGGLVADSAGNLYGTTSEGGNSTGQITGGAVFQLVPNGSGGYSENSIFTFHGLDGAEPASTLMFDHAGNLYGTTLAGGTANTCAAYSGCGVVFKLTPASSDPWTEKVIHFFNGQNGQAPHGGVIFDAAGNLYGATRYGGLLGLCFNIGCGVAYELIPNGKGGWQQTRIFKFAKTNGWSALGNLVLDGSGNAYGTTEMGGDLTCGGKNGCGVAFKLTPSSSGWSLTLLHVFGTTEADGEFPEAGMIFDSSGNLYSTTTFAGLGAGTVFEIVP